jgi:hypothetical protein
MGRFSHLISDRNPKKLDKTTPERLPTLQKSVPVREKYDGIAPGSPGLGPR